jgi:hypothetical protein
LEFINHKLELGQSQFKRKSFDPKQKSYDEIEKKLSKLTIEIFKKIKILNLTCLTLETVMTLLMLSHVLQHLKKNGFIVIIIN